MTTEASHRNGALPDLRVLHVIDSLSASGGAEHGLVREVRMFPPEVTQHVVRLFARDDLEGELAEGGIEVTALGLQSSRAGWNWPLASWRLGSVVDDFAPDVIHSSLFASNMVAQLTGRRKGVPVLSTFTLSGDPDLLRRYQPGADSLKASALRAVAGSLARSDRVHFRALTRDALETNCRLLGVDPGQAHVIPRGIPLTRIPETPKSRSDLGLPEGLPVLINVGRQTAQKGHLALLDAFEVVKGERMAHLVILGRRGDASRELREGISGRGLEADVTVIDYTPDVFHYLAHSSVFVFSSFMEGLGTAVLEAMASGVPVVAFDIPPVREATGDGRFAHLVAPGDVGALAGAVLEVLEDGRDLGGEAETWVAANYSLEVVAARLHGLLADVARGA